MQRRAVDLVQLQQVAHDVSGRQRLVDERGRFARRDRHQRAFVLRQPHQEALRRKVADLHLVAFGTGRTGDRLNQGRLGRSVVYLEQNEAIGLTRRIVVIVQEAVRLTARQVRFEQNAVFFERFGEVANQKRGRPYGRLREVLDPDVGRAAYREVAFALD